MNSQNYGQKALNTFDGIKQLLWSVIDETERLALLGVGSALKADDAAGSEIVGKIINEYSEECSERLRAYSCSTAPENYTGAIRDFHPDHVMIIDAADAGYDAGSVFLIDPETISDVSFSTHTLPLKFLIDYIKCELQCKVTVIGIQPLDVTFGAPVTGEVKKAIASAKNAFVSVFKETGLL